METVKQWDVFQLDLKAQSLYDEEYGVPVAAVFSNKERQYRVNGFWRGGYDYSVRFCPDVPGIWEYSLFSADKGLCATGSFVCEADGNARGFIRKDPDHPYHFLRDDGSHYLMLGTTYYHLSRVAKDDWKACVDGSSRAGFTKIRMHCGGTPGLQKERDFYTADFVYKWITERVGGRFDPTFTDSFAIYENLDEIVRYMQQKDMVADIIMIAAEGRTLRKTDERHFRYLVDRYAAFSNVIWCLCNEWNYHQPVDLAYFVRMGRLVRAADPYNRYHENARLLSLHQKTMIDFLCFDKGFATHAVVQYGVRNGRVTADDEWADVNANNIRYTNGDDWGSASIVYNYGHDMPVVNDEWGYIGEHEDRSEPQKPDGSFQPMTREKHRRILWSVYLSGGYGSTGDKYLHKEIGCRPYFACKWAECAEYADILFFRRLFGSLPFWTFSPAQQRVLKGERVYACGKEGETYLVYCAAGGDVAFDAKGCKTAKLFDLASPQSAATLRIIDGQLHASLPQGKDYLLLMQS